MAFFFNFGEKVGEYTFKVINEREARASAGIMFLLGLFSLFSVYLLRTIFWAEVFSITFILEFFIRTFINPKYAPYMLIGGLIVSNQQPDWVDAKPKQFAWFLGMILGVIMTYYIILDKISLVRLAICWLCLFLLYVESVFGICLGCLLYKAFKKEPELCPGGVCETDIKPKYNTRKLIYILGFLVLFFFIYKGIKEIKYQHKQEIIILNE